MGAVVVPVPSGLDPTIDPCTFIEERRPGFIRYRQTTGRRWEVFGECVKLGYCMIGAVVNGHELTNLSEAQTFVETHSSELDSPVTPEFTGCCPFSYQELEQTEPFTI